MERLSLAVEQSPVFGVNYHTVQRPLSGVSWTGFMGPRDPLLRCLIIIIITPSHFLDYISGTVKNNAMNFRQIV